MPSTHPFPHVGYVSSEGQANCRQFMRSYIFAISTIMTFSYQMVSMKCRTILSYSREESLTELSFDLIYIHVSPVSF